jgi:hypothetical protein
LAEWPGVRISAAVFVPPAMGATCSSTVICPYQR